MTSLTAETDSLDVTRRLFSSVNQVVSAGNRPKAPRPRPNRMVRAPTSKHPGAPQTHFPWRLNPPIS